MRDLGGHVTVTSLFIQEFGRKEFVRLSPKVRDLFQKIDALPGGPTASRKISSSEKRAAVKR